MNLSARSRCLVPLLLMGLCCVPMSAARADIFQCRRPDGSVLFTDLACTEGQAEPLALRENTPMDSSLARANQLAYETTRRRASGVAAEPVLRLIEDSVTRERNARIGAEGKAVKKRRKKGKARKRSRPQSVDSA